MTFDRLIPDKNTGLTDDEKDELVASLEQLLADFADQSDPARFNPHDVQGVSKRLVPYYRRNNKPDECRRLHEQTARAFEHAATLGAAMVASSFLQTAVNEYHSAGLRDEGARARILMQSKIEQSRDEMGKFETTFKVSRDDMENFLNGIIQVDIGNTFARIAVEFLPNRRTVEEQLREGAKDAPLQAAIPLSIMDGNQVVATIGSLDEDLPGRLIHQASINFGLSDLWLWRAIDRAMDKFSIQPEHIVSWANRLEVFDDVSC